MVESDESEMGLLEKMKNTLALEGEAYDVGTEPKCPIPSLPDPL